jgi:AcrR family transcriptional regulator
VTSAACAQIQRRRILDAMVRVVGERGFAGTTVSAVCACAKVSRGTFYQAFDGLQDCFLAVMDEGHRRAHALISVAFEEEERWQDGVRAALASLLTLFDDEPLLARVWLVETHAAGSWALEHRDRSVAALTAMITERWPLPAGTTVSPLAAACVMESVLGIIHSRLLAKNEEPLVTLLGPLMGFIGSVYTGGRAAAAQMEQAEAQAQSLLSGRRARSDGDRAHEVEVPRALRDPRAHRARACLSHLAESPEASNADVARAVGIQRREQISRLLARLHALGLLAKRPARPGGSNTWLLTPYGVQVTAAMPFKGTAHRLFEHPHNGNAARSKGSGWTRRDVTSVPHSSPVLTLDAGDPAS